MDIRKGTISDIDFITDAIIASEKSGTNILSYARIFSITEAEVKSLIKNILEEEIPGQEWNPEHFYIGQIDGIDACCLSAWCEGENGTSSAILKAQALSYFLGDAWQNAAEKTAISSQIQIPRLKLAIQLENIYTLERFRGMGLAGKIIEYAIKDLSAHNAGIAFAEIQLMSNNTAALRSYTKCGFLHRTETQVSVAEILTLLPGNGKISLMRPISNG